MKILALSDIEEAVLYEEVTQAKIGKIDLIISCGDLSIDYLSYISTVYCCAPLFYVRGNHDLKIGPNTEIGENLHNRIVTYRGYRFLGLEGSPRYNNNPIQYSENEMNMLANKAIIKSWFLGKPDVVVAHATPKGIHEGQDYAHRGFPSFNKLITHCKPRYFLHGHNHLSYTPLNQSRSVKIGETMVINVYGHYVFDLD